MNKRERYWLIVVDEYGKELWRRPVWRRHFRAVPWVLGAALLIFVSIAVHSFMLRHVTREAVRLSAESMELRQELRAVEASLPPLKRLDERAQLSFTKIWNKSGLGKLPALLGVGPIEGIGSVLSTSQKILDDVPRLRAQRITAHGRYLQSDLDSLIEYFHDANRLLSNTPSVRPTPAPQTSAFGRRSDPMTGQRLMHKGIDFGGQIGNPIRAPADGVVIFTGRRGGYGMVVVLDHGYGLQTHFAHLSGYRVKPGQRIRRGQIIAVMGSTGKSTGPHLHYEVRRLGRPLDPASFLLD